MKLKNGLEIPEFGMGSMEIRDNPENEKRRNRFNKIRIRYGE